MHSYNKASQGLAVGLSVIAGYIDALGFISSNVFVSFMSGNSTRFAVGFADAPLFMIGMMSLTVIFVFVVGVMLGRVVRHYCRNRPSTMVLVLITALLSCAGVFYECHVMVAAIPFLALSMGAANNIFVQRGEVSIGVTYMTGTLVKFGQRLAGKLLGEDEHDWLPYLLLWVGLVAGAVLGSVGYAAWGIHALWPGVAACFGLTVICAHMERRILNPNDL